PHSVIAAALLCLLAVQTATAQLTFVTNNAAITITGFAGSPVSLNLPTATNGYPVTMIAGGAFANLSSLTQITIPNSITNIGPFALENSGLTNVAIPASVTGIGQGAFASCGNLTNISVSAGNPAYMSLGGVLFDRAAVTLLQYPGGLALDNYSIPTGVTGIADDAFYGATGLGGVTIPNSVRAIGEDAFAYCEALEAVYFGGNAPDTGDDAFYETGFGNGITSYFLPGTAGWTAFSASLGQWLAASLFWYQPAPEILIVEPSPAASNNPFGFTISWATNAAVVVEASTNLSNPRWQPISTNTITAAAGTNSFSDPQSRNYPVRFYRLRAQ
ncbi:MAG: leucine-rich repeat domain-containing protein, partial [Limisphaerales bacterium]